MGFFERNRKALAERGIDPDRLPPGQYFTERFPVLHVGSAPTYPNLDDWTLTVFGAVDRELVLSWADLLALPATELVTDIHCVTKWTKFDTVWTGVRMRDLFRLAGAHDGVAHVVMHAEGGYTANLPIEDVTRDDSLVAYAYGHQPLEQDHGYPLRSLVPHLYFWKSVKWLRGIELVTEDRPGFWERNGYHDRGDPWQEQRYQGD